MENALRLNAMEVRDFFGNVYLKLFLTTSIFGAFSLAVANIKYFFSICSE